MHKISWFRRLFWTWDRFVAYFEKTNNEVNLEARISELKAYNDDLHRDKEERIKDKEAQKNRIAILEKENNALKALNNQRQEQANSHTSREQSLQKVIDETKIKLNEQISKNKTLEEIRKKLDPISKIQKTFFDQAGNKGIGELGELQISVLLERSGLTKDFWTENLIVGSNTVEFAIKSGHKGKWIPIDSKVISPTLDENEKAIIDDRYVAKIKVQAKEITKYLGKSNTTSYGVLVLQSDSIYMSVYDHFPSLFPEITRDLKIYIASPSSFIQMAWSISQIVDIYDRVKNDEKIYEDMMSALNSIANFANSLQNTQKSFNAAMNRHFPALENKHISLKKSLEKAGKLKSIKKITKEVQKEI